MRARGYSLLRLLAGLALTVLLTLAAAPVRAQDDGARVYQLAPVGAQTITTFLVNKRGEIVKRYVGAPNFDELHKLIEKLLAEA